MNYKLNTLYMFLYILVVNISVLSLNKSNQNLLSSQHNTIDNITYSFHIVTKPFKLLTDLLLITFGLI